MHLSFVWFALKHFLQLLLRALYLLTNTLPVCRASLESMWREEKKKNRDVQDQVKRPMLPQANRCHFQIQKQEASITYNVFRLPFFVLQWNHFQIFKRVKGLWKGKGQYFVLKQMSAAFVIVSKTMLSVFWANSALTFITSNMWVKQSAFIFLFFCPYFGNMKKPIPYSETAQDPRWADIWIFWCRQQRSLFFIPPRNSKLVITKRTREIPTMHWV